jgi:glutathione synthase/RimK-type ligase-like ATP-grasp enzyme
MLLVLTNSDDVTADHLLSVTVQHEIGHLRFDTDRGLEQWRVKYASGQPVLTLNDGEYRPADFHHVWYRRPERLKVADGLDSPEVRLMLDEWGEAFEGFFAHIPKDRWVNHPSVNAAASHKLEQLTTAAALGFRTPDTLVTQDPAQLRAFAARHGGKIIAKPMGRGYVERPEDEQDSLIYTNDVSAEHLENLDDLAACPTLFQERLDKTADIRITIVGTDIHAVELLASDSTGSQRCDIRRNNMEDVKHRLITLPDDVTTRLRALMMHYGLRFAAIDMVIGVTGDWYFLETNPNGQWAWMDLIGVTNIAESFVSLFSV